MASMQQIVRNLNAKPTTMSLNERFAMLSSTRQNVQSQPEIMFSPPRGASSQPMQFTSPPKGGMDFAEKMAAAKNRRFNGAEKAQPVQRKQQKPRGTAQRSPMKQLVGLRSPQRRQEERQTLAQLQKATNQNRRLAQQMMARPTAVRMAQKLKKRSVMQRLGTKNGQQTATTGRRPVVGGAAANAGGKPRGQVGKAGGRRSLGALRSPMRSPQRSLRGKKSLLGGRLGAKVVPITQRLGPKQGSPQKPLVQQNKQQKNKQNGQQVKPQQQKNKPKSGKQNNTNQRGGNNNKPVRYFDSAPQQQQQKQPKQKFTARNRGRGGANKQPSRNSLDNEMDSYWQK